MSSPSSVSPVAAGRGPQAPGPGPQLPACPADPGGGAAAVPRPRVGGRHVRPSRPDPRLLGAGALGAAGRQRRPRVSVPAHAGARDCTLQTGRPAPGNTNKPVISPDCPVFLLQRHPFFVWFNVVVTVIDTSLFTGVVPPGVSAVSRYTPPCKSVSADITGGRVHLGVSSWACPPGRVLLGVSTWACDGQMSDGSADPSAHVWGDTPACDVITDRFYQTVS